MASRASPTAGPKKISVTKGVANLSMGSRNSGSANSAGSDQSPLPERGHRKTNSNDGLSPLPVSPGLSVKDRDQARRRLSVTAGTAGVDASTIDGAGKSSEQEQKAMGPNATRRRLSVMGGVNTTVENLDGIADVTGESKQDKMKVLHQDAKSPTLRAQNPAAPADANKKKTRLFSHYATLSKVGYVPFNPHKVNQDRAVEIVKFGGSEDRAFFGVFDGHGALGHEVSSFLIRELPQYFLKQKNLESEAESAIQKAFVDCNSALASSAIDCTFSGSTGIVVYLNGNKLFSCNAGDSRAVLGRVVDNKVTAIALSNDQKPERPDERKRIIESKGRVEACKGMRGEDIGPPRVWLMAQDVPGLAMSRSFGDLIAASVGVIPKPEVWEREVDRSSDKFFILASDGVWEFISNQEAVEIVHRYGGDKGQNAEDAVRHLVDEAVKRWHREEEVVDDITCIVVYF